VRSVIAVIRREYLQRVRTLAFVLSTIALPVFMILAIVVPAFFAARGTFDGGERVVAVVDRTGQLAERVAERLEGAGYTVEPGTHDEAALAARVVEGELLGYLVLDGETLATGRATLAAGGSVNALRRVAIGQAVQRSALEVRLQGTGDDVGALLAGGEVQVRRLDQGGSGPEDGEGAFLFAFFGTFLLYVVIIVYAIAVLRAVMEEKNGRIVEIIVSSMRPSRLMLGKILGVGAAGLTQLAIWLLAGALIFSAGIPFLLAALPEGVDLADVASHLPGPGLVLLWTAYFLLGYFLYASLYAAIGAMCSSEEEVQQVQLPVLALLMVPFVFTQMVIESPETTLSVSLSLVPFFTPLLMFARVATGVVPAWQVGLSLVLMVLAIGAVAWLAGRIYRVGILMQGKRPTVPELWRWVREG
jgi:ABC-2 type transport system permease protein